MILKGESTPKWKICYQVFPNHKMRYFEELGKQFCGDIWLTFTHFSTMVVNDVTEQFGRGVNHDRLFLGECSHHKYSLLNVPKSILYKLKSGLI